VSATAKPAARRRPAKVVAVLRVVAQQLLAVVTALVLAGIVVELSGFSAPDVASALAASFTDDLYGTLRWTTPLVLTGLATCVAFRGRVWNIGFDGQLFVGASAGAVVALRVADGMPAIAGIPLVLLAATAGGAAWAGIAGVLRVRWGAPEIITTIILIDVARLLTSYLVLGPMAGSSGLAAAESTDLVGRELWLTPLAARTQASAGLYIALAVVLVIAVYLFRTRQGYELKLFGHNPRFTFYGGVDNPRVFMRAMLISGGLSGLAGGIEVLGVMHRLPSEFGSGLGFQGIAVSLVAANNPLGIVVSALFFGGLKDGGTSLQVLADTPREVVDIVSAIVILVITAKVGHSLLHGRRRHDATVGSDVLPSRET
jgi:simple sugar transport system permease protein